MNMGQTAVFYFFTIHDGFRVIGCSLWVKNVVCPRFVPYNRQSFLSGESRRVAQLVRALP